MATRYSRIEANCKTIWGDKDYDFEVEGGCMFAADDTGYQIFVREDRGTSWGPNLTMTFLCKGEETAWNELDRMLQLAADEERNKKHKNAIWCRG
jgi:hypothetical protein